MNNIDFQVSYFLFYGSLEWEGFVPVPTSFIELVLELDPVES